MCAGRLRLMTSCRVSVSLGEVWRTPLGQCLCSKTASGLEPQTSEWCFYPCQNPRCCLKMLLASGAGYKMAATSSFSEQSSSFNPNPLHPIQKSNARNKQFKCEFGMNLGKKSLSHWLKVFLTDKIQLMDDATPKHCLRLPHEHPA